MGYDVCLDPGHGEQTPGKRSPDGAYREYEFARDMCRRIRVYLERCGLKVFQTVEDDSDPSLKERCRRANESGAKVVVSIHSNAAGGSGWQAPNYWMCGVIGRGGQAEKLGKAVENEFLKAFPDVKSNGVSTENWAIVRETKAPAVLVEHGFHTNQTWTKNILQTDAGREKLAEADARGICAHLGVPWKKAAPAEDLLETPDAAEKWYEKELAEAVRLGITDGSRPEESCTRAEAAIMVLRAVKGEK